MSLGETAVGQALASGAWTITLLAILSVLYVIFMGLGYWLYSVVIPRSVNTRWQYLFWLGLIALVGTLQILHFFSAVNWEMRLMFGLIGCAGFVQLVRKGWLPASSRRGFLILAMLMPMALFIANQALGDPKHGDSGLYHFQAIQWITSFHVGPGLGNLHEWLGFNQSYFLYAAVLKIGPSVLQEYHLANGLLLLALAIELFRGMSQLFDDGLVIGALIRLLLIVPLAYYSTSVVNVSSPTPDAAVFVLGILIFIYLADFVSTNYDQKDLPEVLIIMLLATLLITFKLTLIVFAAGTLVTVAGIFLRHEMKVGLPQLFALGKGFALSCVLLIPWILRGIVTSGYPLFPSAAFGLPVDWRVPYALVRNSGNVVRSWARLPEGDPEVVLGNWEWLQPWSRSFLDEHTIVLYLIGIGLFLSVVLYLAGAKRLPPMGKWVTPIPVLIAAIGFWFWAAPSFRFIEPVMLSLLAWFWAPPLIASIGAIDSNTFRLSPKTAFISAVFLAYLVTIATERVKPFNIIPEPIPTVSIKVFKTHSGLSVMIPLRGHFLWRSPLPGAIIPRANLILRDGGLDSGFRLEGTTPTPDLVNLPRDESS